VSRDGCSETIRCAGEPHLYILKIYALTFFVFDVIILAKSSGELPRAR